MRFWRTSGLADAEAILRAVLQGESVDWPGGSASAEQQFTDLAATHGVLALVESQLRSRGVLERWPLAIRARLRSAALGLAAVTAVREEQLRRVIDRLAAEHVGAILIKGAALARTHYRDAALRPCGDVDFLVKPADLNACREALRALGYSQLNETDGSYVTYQHHFERDDPAGIGLVVDLHWKINNPQRFADVLTFDEIDREAVAVAALGPRARCPCAVHALFHALVHHVAHGSGAVVLLTLSDIHRLVESLPPDDLRRVGALAIDRRMAAVALTTLRLAREWFGTALPDDVMGELARAAARPEPSAAHLRSMRRIDVLRSDLAALGGWRARTRLVREHVLPPASYILQAYGVSSRVMLPALYAHRFVAGARRWFRKPG
jgi:Uncharacterised nucleotidyltransferase